MELQNTQNIIKRTRIFDDIDSKYGIPEEDREKADQSSGGEASQGGGMDMGGMGGISPEPSPEPAAPAAGGEPPLSESKKKKILGMLGEGDNLDDLFNMEKAQRNIYEIENKLKDILND
jgi:hypothetical protein